MIALFRKSLMRTHPVVSKFLLFAVIFGLFGSPIFSQSVAADLSGDSAGAFCVACSPADQGSGTPKPSSDTNTASQPSDQKKDPKKKDKDDAGPKPVTLKSVFLNLPGDQKAIWTSPSRLRPHDALWFAPTIATFGVLIGSDRHSMARAQSTPDAINTSENVANAGIATLLAVPAGMYVFGSWQGNSRQRETGLLAGEAVMNAYAVGEAIKLITGRDRPSVGNGEGKFFSSWSSPSFPSTHSILSWASASVIAHEYPGPLTQLLAYGTAGAVSAARWGGQKHFFSDVAIGAALGWYMGREVYRSHSHYSDADMAKYGTFVRVEEDESEAHLADRTRMMGSSYLPLDSWAYPALERLAALGYIHTASLSLRPWTRLECARLILEAANHGAASDAPAEVRELYESLSQEFAYESQLMNGQQNLNAQEESAYSRFLGISGAPLTDNYHFGQTLLNDYGRPYEKGFNAADGASGYATAGPLVLYVRGEYQSSPSAPAPTQAMLDFFH